MAATPYVGTLPYFGTYDPNMGPQAPTQYGYGTQPGGPYGYYEQQTPVGSFAAANYAQMPRQQLANTYTAQGQNAGVNTIQGVGPVAAGMQANPYLGKTTPGAQAYSNSMAGLSNPYLDRSINAATQDATQAWQSTVAPQLSAADQASGSFGNTGVQAMKERAYQGLGRDLGNIATNARMADYNQQFQAAENLANRQTGVSQGNAALSAADLARNMAGAYTGQAQGLQAQMFDAGNALNAQTFNAGAGNTNAMFNAGQGNQLAQYNAGAHNTGSMFNAGQGNTLGQNAAALNQGVNLANAGAGNNMLNQYRNLAQNADQFGQNMDLQTWQQNVNNMRNGNLDTISFLNALAGIQNQGINAATTQQNTPLNYWQQLLAGGSTLGGQGGTASQNLQGNPYLGGLGGWLTASQLVGK